MGKSNSIVHLPFLSRAANLLLSRFQNNNVKEDNQYNFQQAVRPLVDTEEIKKRYQKSGLNSVMLNNYEVVLVRYIEMSKAYLNTDLNLEEVSIQTKIPKHHITQVLNDNLRKNFYEFINEYRIKEAVRILRDDSKKVNLLSLAFDCGFNSKSSFNNYFKKFMRETPSSFRKKMTSHAVSVM